MRLALIIMIVLLSWVLRPSAQVVSTPATPLWVWLGGSNATLSTSVASFFAVSGFSPAASSATVGNVQSISSGAYTAQNLRCVFMGSNGTVTVVGGTSYVVALQVNNSSSALTCTATAAQSSCSDSTHTVSISANDILNYTATPSGTPTALEAKCSMEAHI